MNRHIQSLACALLAGLMLSACRAVASAWEGPRMYWSAAEEEALRLARAAQDRGAIEEAWKLLAPLCVDHPSDLDLACWLQDLRGDLLTARSTIDPALQPWLEFPDPEEALRKFYAAEARARSTPAPLVLAARIESDAIASLALLDMALELEPDFAWAHFGRSHALLRNKALVQRWEMARAALTRALALDPSSLRARRLEVWMLAQEGAVREARQGLERWLERAQGDFRVSRAERTEAEVDLALLRVLDGDAAGARELCRALEGNPVARSRRLAIEAVAAAEKGDVAAAFEAARKAADASPQDVLPHVQQALLQQYWLQDADAAAELWSGIVERAGATPDLSTLLQGMRAQLYLERRAKEGGQP